MLPVRRPWLGLLALWGLCACSDAADVAPPFAFNRPEHLAFLCIDKSAEADEKSTQRPLVLPMNCCAYQAPLAPTDSPYTEPCGVKDDGDDKTDDAVEPVLHALISQSTRGEVAAVDLRSGRVIDTDRVVPGYTYIDVGGLPTAIVAPPARPELKGGDTDFSDDQGPPFVYVASAEDMAVRAVASCRFQSERSKCSLASVVGQDLVALPSPPRDMVLGPDFALWVSLPDVGLLARIPLSSIDGQPFERIVEPEFFAIPSLGEVEPAEPTTEPELYRAACGLGYTITPEPLTLALPTAPLASFEGGPRPSRLRYDTESKLLLVADQSEPAVRAFSIEDGVPVARGAALTGAPVRDFVLTPFVPARVSASESEFPLQESAPREGEPNPPRLELLEDTLRYLYAVDDRDGSLLVHAFSYDDASGAVSTTPLQMPYGTRFKDRVVLAAPALALEVIDTRPLSAPACGLLPEAYDPDRDDERFEIVQTLPRPATLRSEDFLDDRRVAAETRRNNARKAYNAKPTAENEAALEEAEDAYLRARTVDTISDRAEPYQLRGVFLAVSSTDGVVRIVDVHDLDVFCRGRVCDLGDDLVNPDSNELGVAIQRHARRLGTSNRLTTLVSDGSRFAAVTCPDGYRPAHQREAKGEGGATVDETITCIPRDPWRAANDAWTITYEGALPGFPNMPGYVEETDGEIVVRAPAGVDFCARGVMAGSIHPEGPGDALAVVVDAPSELQGCRDVDAQNPALYQIVDAFSDRLVLDRLKDTKGKVVEGSPTLSELERCYPESLAFQVRLRGEFLVTGANTGSQHRLIADEDGHCVIDDTRDEHLNMRARAGERFVNPFVAFLLDEKYGESPFTTQVQQTLEPVQESIIDPNGRVDALPVTLQYLPYTGDLFVVDAASQGIRRFGLAPFGPTSTGLR